MRRTGQVPAISLVLSTKGEQPHTARLLESLARQSFGDFELIIVEQNPQSLIRDLIERNWNFPIKHVHTPDERGVSRARNSGLGRARGEFVLFPDDDCWYPETFLDCSFEQLTRRKLDALTGRPTSVDGRTVSGRFEKDAQWITRANVWTTQIEWLALWRRDLLERLGGFDDFIGVGADSPWRSAEGQDLMLRALQVGARCWYDPTLIAHDYALDPANADDAFIAKARAYGRGLGHVLRKHRIGFATSSYFLVRPIGGALFAAVRGRLRLAQYYVATGIGRLEGILGRCFVDGEYDTKLLERAP